MIFFTALIFIAELIILYQLVVFLIKTDRAVCALAEHVDKRRNILKWRMTTLTEISVGINEILPNLLKKLKKSRRNLMFRLANEVAQGTILLFFRPKYKKIVLGIKSVVSIVRKTLKRQNML